jgi:hypothetical protein
VGGRLQPDREPGDVSGAIGFPRHCDAVRAIDPDHILFLEGNRYSVDRRVRRAMGEHRYTVHDYALPGLYDGGDYPG